MHFTFLSRSCPPSGSRCHVLGCVPLCVYPDENLESGLSLWLAMIRPVCVSVRELSLAQRRFSLTTQPAGDQFKPQLKARDDAIGSASAHPAAPVFFVGCYSCRQQPQSCRNAVWFQLVPIVLPERSLLHARGRSLKLEFVLALFVAISSLYRRPVQPSMWSACCSERRFWCALCPCPV